MNHKYKNTKNQRAGCLMCKPHKANGCDNGKIGHRGFGKLRGLYHAKQDLKQYITH